MSKSVCARAAYGPPFFPPMIRKRSAMKLIACALVLQCILFEASFAQNLAAKRVWPHPIPCRVRDGENKDLLIATLGDVETLIADGVFDPFKDDVRLKDGSVLNHYYRDTLGVKYFAPIDKSRFTLPPSGWCSWYYYYQEINENEIKLNTDWIDKNLKDYGARYVQIDDGWQGTGHGLGENRDWTTIDKRFPGGMARLAAYIKGLG